MKTKDLLIMVGLHFVVMFFLMYAMIDTFDHFYLNINKVYMATIMTAPMLIIEIALMRNMYQNKKALNYILGFALIIFFAAFYFIRTQTFVGDRPFLRAMIPHHSSAILMCEEANIEDPEIVELCDQIIKAQKDEIRIMKNLLEQ